MIGWHPQGVAACGAFILDQSGVTLRQRVRHGERLDPCHGGHGILFMVQCWGCDWYRGRILLSRHWRQEKN